MDAYKQNVDSTLNSIKFVRENANSIYGSNELQNRHSYIENNEFVKMLDYNDKKQNIHENKLRNLEEILQQERNLSADDLKILQDSTSLFNNDFNDNVKKMDNIDKEIMTKDRIIILQTMNSDKKQRLINAMKSVLLYIGLMFVPIFFMAMKYISTFYGILFIFICGIITLIVILVRLRKESGTNVQHIVDKSKETAKDFVKTLVKDVFPKSFVKPCPKRCRPHSGEEEQPPLPVYDYNHGNEVWLDNSQNKWKKGDIPTIGATEEGYLALGEDAEPMRYYKGDATTPQYTCRWKYDPKKMTNMDKGQLFTTTIPCEFYPGYETVGN